MNSSVACIVLLCVSAALLCSCGAEPLRPVSVAHGGRVGLATTLTPEITNLHRGFTVFGNYDNRLANDWHLDRFAQAQARTLLENAGYEVVDIHLDQQATAAIQAGDDQDPQNFNGLNRAWIDTYAQMLAAHQLSALVVLRDKIEHADMNGPNGYHGYVIGSSIGRTPDFAQVFLTVSADVVGDSPPHRAGDICLAREKFATSLIHVDNFKDIKSEDLAPIRPIFESLLTKKMRFDLARSGLLHEVVYCPSYFPGKNVDPAVQQPAR